MYMYIHIYRYSVACSWERLRASLILDTYEANDAHEYTYTSG